MARNWIVVGDPTSSGGSVITGSPFTDVDGTPVARVNDQATCPRHKGAYPIIDGDSTLIVDGQPVALHGSSLACGCKVLSARQARVFVDAGGGASDRAGSVGGNVGGAWVAQERKIESASLGDESCARRTSGKNASKARDVIVASHQALMDAGAYRSYETEVEAAREWRKHVLSIANSEEFQVEVGALITRVAPGDFRLGAPYSSGHHDKIEELIQRAPRSAGALTASIHTHPHPNGWVGADRALSYQDDIDEFGVGGYAGEGDIQAGDLVVHYFYETNAYIADEAGLNGWIYQEFRKLQASDKARAFRLGEVYRRGL